MKSKWTVGLGALLVVIVTIVLARKQIDPNDGRLGRLTPVRIGYLPIYVDLPLFVAKERGFFAQRGIEVELVRFSASPEIGTALLTGNIQFGASIALPVALSTEIRDPGRLRIFIVDSENKDNYISSFVAMPASGIRSLQDLHGRTVGSFPGPNAVTFCKILLRQAGIDPDKDVKLVELEVSSHISALTAGTVDALFTYEPTATQAVIEKGAVKFLPGAVERNIISPWMAGVWVGSTDFASRHPEETEAVVGALYDGIRFLRSNPLEGKAALAGYTSIKPEVAAQTPNIPFSMLDEVNIEMFQKNADLFTEHGLISRKLDVRTLLAPMTWVRR